MTETSRRDRHRKGWDAPVPLGGLGESFDGPWSPWSWTGPVTAMETSKLNSRAISMRQGDGETPRRDAHMLVQPQHGKSFRQPLIVVNPPVAKPQDAGRLLVLLSLLADLHVVPGVGNLFRRPCLSADIVHRRSLSGPRSAGR